MATMQPPTTPISSIRRKLLSPTPESPTSSDLQSETVDFESASRSDAVIDELQEIVRPAAAAEYEDVDALLARYQLEKGNVAVGGGARSNQPALIPARRPASAPELRLPAGGGSFHGELLRPRSVAVGLPPLSSAARKDGDRLRNENGQLKQLVAEYRQVIESNDLHDWEQKIQEAEELLNEKDHQIDALRKQVEEWTEKLKVNRFVPSDDELSHTADELDQERAGLSRELKQLEGERKQLKEDEESLMNQMREMEVGMAKDRAELARQRTDLQRLHTEIRHELELLQRGDATVKEQLAQFKRRHQSALGGQRPTSAPTPSEIPAIVDIPVQEKPRDSMFKRFFGQSG